MILLQVGGMTRASGFHDPAGKPFARLHLVELCDDIFRNVAVQGQLHLCAALFQEKNAAT